MASQPSIHLGIYWASQSFSLVAVAKNEILAHETVPYNTPIDFGTGAGQDLPLPLRQAALLQKTLNENSVVPDKVALAIPPQELLFRVFTVPSVAPSELPSLVEYEAIKHIPLSIDELAFTFLSETITEGEENKTQIYFCGIKKGRLKQYLDVCEQSGFKPLVIEPAGQGICRALIQQKIIPKAKTTAVVIINGHESLVGIVDRHRLIFLREFHGPAVLDASTLNPLVTELRTLLAFFRRQQPNKTIEQMIMLNIQPIPESLTASLQETFEIPVVTITTKHIRPELADVNEILAYTTALGLQKNPLQGFNLIKSETPVGTIQISDEFNVRLLVGSLLIALGIVASAWLYGRHLTSGKQQELDTMREQQGKFASSTTEDIQALTDELRQRHDTYQKIRIDSDTASILKTLAKTLPEAAWIETIKIEYQDETSMTSLTGISDLAELRVTLFGGLFHPDPQEAFGRVNNLIESLRENFQDRFQNVVLVSINKKDVQGHPIAAFRIDLY